MGTATSSCIIPPALEVEVDDAGVSSPPVIQSSAAPFEFPGPFTLSRDDTDAVISLTLYDLDLEDSLFVRLFLDYDPTSGAGLVADCTAPPTGDSNRVASCPASTICNRIDESDTNLHTLEAMVTDRPWLTADDPAAEGQDPLRATALDSTPSIRGWTMRCQ